MKLRMLLKDARVDPGLIEVTRFGGPRVEPNQEFKRVREGAYERDVDPKTGEVFREYLRGVLSIELCFISDGDQPTSFDEIREWVEGYMKHGGMARLNVTIEEVSS